MRSSSLFPSPHHDKSQPKPQLWSWQNFTSLKKTKMKKKVWCEEVIIGLLATNECTKIMVNSQVCMKHTERKRDWWRRFKSKIKTEKKRYMYNFETRRRRTFLGDGEERWIHLYD
jgi:hypothetical protein